METKPFSDVVTFTRSTIGTFLNPASGLIETAAINAPRLEAAGLLFETQAINTALRSADFSNATWGKVNSSVVAGVAAPDGTTAQKLVESTASSVHQLNQTGKVVVGNTRYCRSVFAKADGSTRQLQLASDLGSNWVDGGFARFNLDTGTVGTTTLPAGAYGIEAYPNGWYRCWISSTTIASPAAVSVMVHLSQPGSASYLGDGVSGVHVWGYQFEVGAFPTSYIPTVAAQVTKATDVAFAADSGWLRGGEGTLFTEATLKDVASTVTIGALGTTSTSGRIINFCQSGAARASGLVADDAGAVQFVVQNLGPSLTPGQIAKQALAYKTDDFQYSTAGLVSPVDSAGSLPTINRLVLGATGVSSSHMIGHIRRIKYFPYRLTAAQLQALTT